MSYYKPSYFIYHNDKLTFINTKLDATQEKYIPPYNKNTSPILKSSRRHYVNSINEWLNEPLYFMDSDECIYIDNYHTNIDEVVEEQSFFDINSIEDDKYYYEESDEHSSILDYITVENVCNGIYQDIIELMTKNDYNIYESEQFKEDLIHYIYRLSIV